MKKLLRLLLIREDEKNTVLYFMSLFFIIGCGMAMGKASADALFFKRFGIEYLPVMYIGLGVLLTAVSFIYAAFADRMSAEQFFFRLFIILTLLLIAIWSLINYTDSTAGYPIYYLVYEAVSEVLLIHTALYLNQNMDTFKSKRLSPIILAGSQFGLIVGGLLVAILSPIIGTSQIIILWCSMLILAGLLIFIRHKFIGQSAYFYNKHTSNSLQKSLQAIKQGINFSRNSALLRSSSLAFFFLVITFYTLYYVTNRLYTSHFETEEELTAFFGLLTAATSLSALLLQVFVTNRAINKFGIRNVNLLFPLATIFGFVNLILLLKLPSAVIGSFIQNTIGPAFNKPVVNMMFNILPKNIQGRSRAVSIGIILPLALFSCSLILLFAQYFESNYFFLIAGLITSLLFLYFSYRMNKAYISTLIQHLKEQVYLPEDSLSMRSSRSLLHSLEKNIKESDDNLAVSCAKILIKSHPKKATAIIVKRLQTSSNKSAEDLIRILSKHSTKPLQEIIENPEKYPNFDLHVKATTLYILFENKNTFAESYIKQTLNNDNPRLLSTGIFGAFMFKSQTHLQHALNSWIELTRSANTQLLASLELIKIIHHVDEKHRAMLIDNYHAAFIQLLNSDNFLWQSKTLFAMSNWPYTVTNEICDTLKRLFESKNPHLRTATIQCAVLLDTDEQITLLTTAFEDGHSRVRQAAMKTLFNNYSSAESVAQQWLINKNSFITPRAQLTLLDQLLTKGLAQSTLAEMLANKVSVARNYYDALQVLKRNRKKSTAHHLTYSTVSQRLLQISCLLLTILEQFEKTDTITVIKAAINSADQQLIATACEAINSLDDTTTSNVLIDILQDDFELKTGYELSFINITEALNWCKLQDHWLNTCSTKALEYD